MKEINPSNRELVEHEGNDAKIFPVEEHWMKGVLDQGYLQGEVFCL